MKKLLLLFVAAFLAFNCFAQQDSDSGDVEDIPLETTWDNPYDPFDPLPKAPIRIPSVSICGCTLFFSGFHADYSLLLISDDDQVVFETYVPYSVSTVSLPVSLSGSYEIRLVPNAYYFFRGFITL